MLHGLLRLDFGHGILMFLRLTRMARALWRTHSCSIALQPWGGCKGLARRRGPTRAATSGGPYKAGAVGAAPQGGPGRMANRLHGGGHSRPKRGIEPDLLQTYGNG